MNFKTILTAAISVLMLAACADGNYRPYNLDDKFGQSAKQMLNASIADPKAAENPPANSPRKMDGYAGVNTLGTFRSSFNQITQPQGLTINVGSGLSGGGSSGQ
jgi:hypothetical protein